MIKQILDILRSSVTKENTFIFPRNSLPFSSDHFGLLGRKLLMESSFLLPKSESFESSALNVAQMGKKHNYTVDPVITITLAVQMTIIILWTL